MLEKARVMVASGGRIIYISCSLLASEGAEQIKNFLQTAHNLNLLISEIFGMMQWQQPG